MKIGEFAKRTGVTVKTLLHYDKMGLLPPSYKTDVGYRIYSESDFLKLQQITTLKFIGLSLKEIKQLLDEKGSDVGNLITIQKNALEEKKKHIESVINILGKAETQIKESGVLEAEQLIKIIKATSMESKVREQYETATNLNTRLDLHSYNINKTDWSNWCFSQMRFPKKARILELGCGTGDLWIKNTSRINKDWSITLSDFSKGMLEETRTNLKHVKHDFKYEIIDAQDIPYEDESFDIVIARHMLYLVPDIEKALCEIKRVLAKGGLLYATTNSNEAMDELNELMEKFDPKIGLNTNGTTKRFNMENGQPLIAQYFNDVKMDVFTGQIIVDKAEPVVAYKASSIKGSSILVGEKRQDFKEFVQKYLEENNTLSITTKACIFEAKK